MTAPGQTPQRTDHATASGPAIVAVSRGTMTESRHRVGIAVAHVSGSVLFQAGDIETPVYARSGLKPLQALALIETGAADEFDLGDTEIALACASHSGEPAHVEAVRQWLKRIGCSADDLECGAHAPAYPGAAEDLIRAGETPSPLHNNCSGKHSGFLSVARHLGKETRDYIRFDHPVQQRILGILEQMCGLDLSRAPRGTDGCGIPVIGIPLTNIAFAMAQLADPVDQPDRRQEAAARIRASMAARPFFVAGTDRFDTRVIEATQGAALVKTGAEGVHCAIVPEEGLGIAVKAEDGAKRAAEAAMAGILRWLGPLGGEATETDDPVSPIVYNHVGKEVGRITVHGLPGDPDEDEI